MQITLGIIRHLITALGGSIVANGTITEGDLQSIIGALVTIVGIAWSVYEKRTRKEAPVATQ